jgi:AcrR family transcriptional regulator
LRWPEVFVPKTVNDEAILIATISTILQHGYEGATTRLIAAQADINEVTLFRRFGSKDKLVALAVKQEIAAFQAAHIGYTGHLQADLEAIIRFYAALFQQRANLIPTIVSEAQRRPELRDELIKLLPIVERLLAIISRYQDEGVLARGPAIDLIIALLAPLLGRLIVSGFLPEPDAPVDPSAYVKSFLAGYGLSR